MRYLLRWLDRLLGEPPEPRGLCTLPGVPPPSASENSNPPVPADTDPMEGR